MRHRLGIGILERKKESPTFIYRGESRHERREREHSEKVTINVVIKYCSILVYEDYDQAVASFESGTGR